MGTSSRLVIARRNSADINFWIHWDGYFSGVGNDLCEQLKVLLEKYTVEQIIEMLEALSLEEEGQNFNTSDLIPFIEGKVSCCEDLCEEFLYLYALDFEEGTLSARANHLDIEEELDFEQIRKGEVFSSSDEDGEESEAEEDEENEEEEEEEESEAEEDEDEDDW